MIFWLITGALALLAVAIVAASLLRSLGDPGEAINFDLQIYRDQLAEVERDLARGTLDQDEAERARTEISRRLLAADRAAREAARPPAAPRGATWAAIGFAGLVLVGGTGAVYFQLGANRPWSGLYPDMGLAKRIAMANEVRATRPSQAEFEATLPGWDGPPPEAGQEYLDLVDRLRAAVAQEPGDLQGNQLLALHESRLGNFVAAHRAMRKVLDAKGDSATGDDYTQYADLLIMAANGYVSPEAEAALARALRDNPEDPVARYYTGLMFAQTGRPDRTFPIWRDLLEESRPEAPWVEPIREQLPQIAAVAGVVNFTLPEPGISGPSADQIAAAQSMSAEERQAMIEGMVAQLSDRLANAGGSSREWAQLIGALAVLGRTDQARAVWIEAQQTFGESPEDLARIRAAGRNAGLDAEAPQPVDPDAAAQARRIDNEVTRLSDKLATSGGPGAEWARLIELLGQLGETDRARAIWNEAQTTFAEEPVELAFIRAAAQQAGVAE